MAQPATKFPFGEWLPDQPDLDNPGLTEAKGVLRVAGNYQPYLPLVAIGSAIAQSVKYAQRVSWSSGYTHYAGSDDGTHGHLYGGTAAGAWTDISLAGTYSTTGTWSLAQYNNYVIATNGVDNPQFHTIGSGANFAQLTGSYGAAPVARCVGIVNQFVVLGNLTSEYNAIQWCGINSPLNWPAPASANAIAQQSGTQSMEADYLSVLGVSQGDQWGLVLMDGGIVRMTYRGGDTVFQFDTIHRGPGPLSQNAWVKAGDRVYFASSAGFFVCDGTAVTPIGRGKVDAYFLSKFDAGFPNSVSVGVDVKNRLIRWTFPKSGDSGSPSEVLCFNYDDGSWTHALDTVKLFIHAEDPYVATDGLRGFSNTNFMCQFTGTPSTATIVTAEKEFNPGGRVLCRGFKPLVSGTSPTVTAKIGSRNDLGASVTYTAALTPTATSGFADCLVDARYLRAEVDVTGSFTNLIGGEFDADASSNY